MPTAVICVVELLLFVFATGYFYDGVTSYGIRHWPDSFWQLSHRTTHSGCQEWHYQV